MKILIDARVTTIGGPSTYMNSLVESILKHDATNNEYFVLYNKGQKQIFPGKSTALVTSSKSPIYWLFWDNVILPRIVKKHKIDIYHSLKRPEIARIKTKKIITIHAAHPFMHPQLQTIGEKIYWNQRLKMAARKADAIIAVSSTDRQNLIQSLDLPAEKVNVHHLALDKKYTDAPLLSRHREGKKQANLPGKYILFIGTQFLYKNIPSMLKAFKMVKKNQKIPHKFVLVGKAGSASKEINKMIQELSLSDDVIMPGIVDDISAIYANADVFLFPTLYDAFGFPVLEAMAHGVPVIISTAGALPEVAGEAALKFDPFDVDGISKGIHSLITDTALRDKMIKRGYKRIQKFSWERCAKETISVYKKVFDT